MDLGALDEDGYLRLMQRLEGSGYSKDEDGNRVGELRSIAKIAVMVTEALNEAFANLFLQSCTSALDLIERTKYLVQGSSLSTAERRARLLAYQQGSWLVEARLSNAFATYLADTTGVTQRPAEVEARAHAAAPGSGLLVARREPAATTKQRLRDLAPVLSRGLPARAIAAGVSQRDATWGDALAPAGIALTPAVSVPAQTKARVAPIEVMPGDVVTREEWVEIQSMLCPKSYGYEQTGSSQGRTILIHDSIAAGGTYTDGPTTGGIAYGERIVQAWGVVDGSALSDPTALDASHHLWLAPSKMGTAGSGYTHAIYDTQAAPVVSGLTVHVNGGGDLVVTNTTGGTLYVLLMIRSTPPYVVGSSTKSQPWIRADQADKAALAEIYAAQLISEAGAPGLLNGVNAGALRRVVYSGPLYYQAGSGIPQGVILDSSEDWRDRWVLVTSIMNRNAFANLYPLPSTVGMLAQPTSGQPHPPSAPLLFYTGTGAARGSSTADPYQQPLYTPLSVSGLPNVWLFADLDGNLCVEMKDGLSDFQAASVLALVTATEKTAATSVVTPVPVHPTQVQTIDFEQPQNCGVFAQGMQGGVPRYLITDPAPRVIPTCPPLGIVSDGSSPVRPVSWMVRERLGALDDAKYEVRQKITGQRRRIVSVKAPAHSVTPIDDFNHTYQMFPAGQNDQVDFRDRLLWAEGRYSTNDITIGNASQVSDVSAPGFLAIIYTGPVILATANPATSLGQYTVLIATGLYLQFEFSRGKAGQGFHSRLVLTNTSASDVYVNMTVDVSGFLGLTDRRAPGQAI